MIKSLTFSGSPPKITILTPLSSSPLTSYTLPPSTLSKVSSLITSPISASDFYALLKSELMLTVKSSTKKSLLKIVRDNLDDLDGGYDLKDVSLKDVKGKVIADLESKRRSVLEGIRKKSEKKFENVALNVRKLAVEEINKRKESLPVELRRIVPENVLEDLEGKAKDILGRRETLKVELDNVLEFFKGGGEGDDENENNNDDGEYINELIKALEMHEG